MVNFNVYLNMEKLRNRGSRRRRSRSIRRSVAATARARVPNELHGAAIAQSLEHNLPLAINSVVWRALKAALQADQGQDREIQAQEHPRPEEQEEDLSLQGHSRTVQDLHGAIARNLQHNLHDLIRGAVMSAMQPNQGQDQVKQDLDPAQKEQPQPEEQATPDEQPILGVQATPEEQATPDEQPILEEQATPDEHPNIKSEPELSAH